MIQAPSSSYQGGEEVATDDDDPARGVGKHGLGGTGRGGLVHYVVECGTDDLDIDLYTSTDLRECHLVGNEEEWRFLGGVFHRISIPEAEFALAQQHMDDITRDVEVNAIRALLLARGARIRHGHAMTEYKEKLTSAEEEKKKKITEERDSLAKRVEELEAQIAKDKKLVAEASGAMDRIIDLGSEVHKRDSEIKDLKKAWDEAVALAEGRASVMEKSKTELFSCMRDAKAIIDGVFSRGGMEASNELSEVDPKLFADWLSNEVSQFQLLLKGALDVGAYGAAIGLACTLQQLGCHHLKTVRRPSHLFPALEVVHSAIQNRECANAVSRLLLHYWRRVVEILRPRLGAPRLRRFAFVFLLLF